MLLDLALPDSRGIDTFLALRSRCSGIPIIVLSSADSESMALETIRHGGEDYLVKSTCTRDLLIRNVSHAVVRCRRQAEAQAGDVQSHSVAVVGVKGGTGATTVACTLAAELRLASDNPVLLADLDLDSGLVAFFMGVHSPFSILDASQNLERLDSTFWKSLVTEVAGVHVVPSPGLVLGGDMDPSRVWKAIEFARRLYPWTVLDLGRLHGGNVALLNYVTETLLVTTDSIASLHEAKRAIEVLGESGVARERIHLLVNHVDEATQQHRNSDLVKVFGVDVCARLPYEGAALSNALVERRLPGESSAFRSRMRRVARKLLGLEDVPRKGMIPGLVSLLTGNKRRKPVPNGAGGYSVESHA